MAVQRYFLRFYPDRNTFSERDAAEFGHLLAAVAFLLFETVDFFDGKAKLLGKRTTQKIDWDDFTAITDIVVDERDHGTLFANAEKFGIDKGQLCKVSFYHSDDAAVVQITMLYALV